jgi:hypothetical protein
VGRGCVMQKFGVEGSPRGKSSLAQVERRPLSLSVFSVWRGVTTDGTETGEFVDFHNDKRDTRKYPVSGFFHISNFQGFQEN